jgi:phosphopantothenoylcysteine decarboxylase/phosphopantothenate--cysteine ligase
MIRPDQTWENHIEKGLWADLYLIAPASAHSISALAEGRCENLLQAVFLSARCPVMIAPAMDHDMFLHPSTVANLQTLRDRGTLILDPEKGELASGLVGEGRMQEPQAILESVYHHFHSVKLPLSDKKILLTAGPTREPIDAVRFISNHSTGKMGLALAEALRDSGALVVLVAGPMQIPIPRGITCFQVETAEEMREACMKHFPACDAAILSAAVADYRPAHVAPNKIKKTDQDLLLSLEPTTDILAELGRSKKDKQILVGFALETDNELSNAQEKLERKNLDMIVLNSLRDPGAGFATDTNKVTLIFKDKNLIEFPLLSKEETARRIVHSFIPLINAHA